MEHDDVLRIVNHFRNGNAQTFTSHDFINQFVYHYQEQYQHLLLRYNGSKRVTHSVIANYLRYHAEELGITRNLHRTKTFNVTGNMSDSRLWNH